MVPDKQKTIEYFGDFCGLRFLNLFAFQCVRMKCPLFITTKEQKKTLRENFSREEARRQILKTPLEEFEISNSKNLFVVGGGGRVLRASPALLAIALISASAWPSVVEFVICRLRPV